MLYIILVLFLNLCKILIMLGIRMKYCSLIKIFVNFEVLFIKFYKKFIIIFF